MNADWEPDSLEFILGHIREAPEKQVQMAEALDGKMVLIFVAASVIIGLVGFSTGPLSADRWAILPLIGAVSAYVAVAVVAVWHLRPRYIRRNLQADVLWPEYAKYEAIDVKLVVAQDTSDAYAFNKRVLADKADTLVKALVGTALEVVFVGIAISVPLMRAWSTS